MSNWYKDDSVDDPWPVRYPVDRPSSKPGGRFGDRRASRWIRMEGVGSKELQRRLFWLLLAVEIGMAVSAACVLPLVLTDLGNQRESMVGPVLAPFGGQAGPAAQAMCLMLVLPIPMVAFSLGLSLWWYRWGQRRRKEHRVRKGNE